MKAFYTAVKALLLSVCLCFSVQQAQAVSLDTGLISSVIQSASNTLQSLDNQARGFRGGGASKGFGMNFGGNKGTSTTNTATNSSKNTAAAGSTAAGSAAKSSAMRSGIFGFLAGMSLGSMLMWGGGLLGGGFLIYLLIMFLLPTILQAFRQKNNPASSEIPTSGMSSSDVFRNMGNNANNGSSNNNDKEDATFSRRF